MRTLGEDGYEQDWRLTDCVQQKSTRSHASMTADWTVEPPRTDTVAKKLVHHISKMHGCDQIVWFF